MESTSEQILDPWLSMWTKPRATIQQVVDTNPKRLVLVLAAICGFFQALDQASTRHSGDQLGWPTILFSAAIFGPIGGIISLYVFSALVRWTGEWIGGKAPSQNIRAAIAWSCVPIIWGSILWIPRLALFGQELFTTETPRIDANRFIYLGFIAIEAIMGIWAIVVSLKCIGQVQAFSAWKALGNVIMAMLVIVIPISVVIITIVGLLMLIR